MLPWAAPTALNVVLDMRSPAGDCVFVCLCVWGGGALLTVLQFQSHGLRVWSQTPPLSGHSVMRPALCGAAHPQQPVHTRCISFANDARPPPCPACCGNVSAAGMLDGLFYDEQHMCWLKVVRSFVVETCLVALCHSSVVGHFVEDTAGHEAVGGCISLTRHWPRYRAAWSWSAHAAWPMPHPGTRTEVCTDRCYDPPVPPSITPRRSPATPIRLGAAGLGARGPHYPVRSACLCFACDSPLARRARRAKFSPISPPLSPFVPFFVPVLGTPEKAGVM